MAYVEASVIPIAGSYIAWNTFLKDTSRIVGRNLTRNIDASGLKLSEYAKYIVALGELRDKDESNPVDVLHHAGNLLQHVHFSFLITGSSSLIFKISESTRLHIISTRIKKGRFALVSGTLGEWKDATIELAGVKMAEVEWLVEALLEFFFSIGLKYIFAKEPILRLEGKS